MVLRERTVSIRSVLQAKRLPDGEGEDGGAGSDFARKKGGNRFRGKQYQCSHAKTGTGEPDSDEPQREPQECGESEDGGLWY